MKCLPQKLSYCWWSWSHMDAAPDDVGGAHQLICRTSSVWRFPAVAAHSKLAGNWWSLEPVRYMCVVSEVSMRGGAYTDSWRKRCESKWSIGSVLQPKHNTKRQRESSGLPARNWTGVALKEVLHQGDWCSKRAEVPLACRGEEGRLE